MHEIGTGTYTVMQQVARQTERVGQPKGKQHSCE
jgi:hypothetical protein